MANYYTTDEKDNSYGYYYYGYQAGYYDAPGYVNSSYSLGTGEAAYGYISSSSDRDYYSLGYLSASGSVYSIVATGVSWASNTSNGAYNTPDVSIYDAYGNLVKSGSGGSVSFGPTYSGQYYVAVSDSSASQYSLSLRESYNYYTPSVSGNTVSLNENSAAGSNVHDVYAYDYDNNILTYAIDSGNTDVDGDGQQAFAIRSSDGLITVNDAGDLNYENRTSFNLAVSATDGYRTGYGTVTVNLNDVREGPTLTSSSYSINENSSSWTYAGALYASNYSGTVTYSITGGNTDKDGDGSLPFFISRDSNGTAYLYVNDTGDLNYENQSRFDLQVSATDWSGTTTTTATVNLNNVNEAPVLANSTLSVNENSSYLTSVGTVTGSDPEGNTLTYSIASGNTDVDGDGSQPFYMTSSGQIYVYDTGDLNYEARSSFALTVWATDSAYNSTTATTTINLNDVLREGPTLTGNSYSINENSGYSTYVGALYASSYSGTVTYSITGGNTDKDGDGSLPFFISNYGNGTAYLYVNDAGDLNYENQSRFDLQVSATDWYGTTTTTATVNLNNLNEAPVLANSTFSVNENSSYWTRVGTVAGSDPEGNALTYSITSGNTDVDGDGSQPFYIGSSGEIYVYDSGDLNYEARSSFSLTVRATDSAYNSTTATATVNLNDVREGPTLTGSSYSINENSGYYTYAGALYASGYSGTVTYSITGGNTDKDGDGALPFFISRQSNGTAYLYVNDAGDLNYENQSRFDLQVSATDWYGTTTTTTTVNLNDVREGPTLTSGSYSINENSGYYTYAGALYASGYSGTVTYSITGGNTDKDGDGALPFFISRQSNGTAYLYVNDAGDLNYENQSRFDLQVSATDWYGTTTTTATVNLANVNDAPTGDVTLSGTATQGETLTVANTLADADGLGTISYQWQANGTDIAGATGDSYSLTQAEVGQTITVVASYTDTQGTAECVSSAATSAVANVNDAPTGDVTLSGNATQGETLTVANTLADTDGLGTISYQWQANGTDIAGATGDSYSLTQAEVGQTITVVASYTDTQGTVERVSSAATSAVANVNDAPTGDVTLSGTATQGETLTVANTLADADGLGTISYQWQANGTDIAGATGDSYSLTQAEVGQTITVVASYTDTQGTVERVSSAATSAVANVNDAPTGSVTISGTALEGQRLQLVSTLQDPDGNGTARFQWLRDNAVITGATASSYTLTAADVGKSIAARLSYTDGGDFVESCTSAAVRPIGLTPGVTISGADRTTGEAGDTALFLVKLDKAPVYPVTIQFAISDATEARLGVPSLTFTKTNWNVAQTLTVTGVDDFDNDGHIAYNLTATIVTNDLSYKRVTVSPIALINQDDTLDVPVRLNGTDDIDYLRGNNGADRLYGRGDMDELRGGHGDDRLYGEGDDDWLYGEDGNDWLYGGYDDDQLSGGSGNDELYGNDGVDRLEGGAGNDMLDGGTGADTMIGGAGNDTYLVDNARDVVNDQGLATDEDTVLILAAIRYKLATNVEKAEIRDSSGAASLEGNALANDLTGNASQNTLDGGAGNDVLDAGAGNDTLLGGVGTDTLLGGLGNDRLDGGTGDDRVDYTDAAAGFVNVNLATGSASGDGADTLISIEDVIGSVGADTIAGSSADNELSGGAGNDQISGDAGNDVLDAGVGNDTVLGGVGTDTLTGGDGSDRLDGGVGADNLYGGTADRVSDVFDFNATTESTFAARDKVYDFVSRIDKINLAGLDANTAATKAGDQAFTFNTTTAKANAIWYKVAEVDGNAATSDIILYGDVNGNTTADFEIGLVGVTSLVVGDLVL